MGDRDELRQPQVARVSALVGVIRGPVWQSGMVVPLQRSQYSAGPVGLVISGASHGRLGSIKELFRLHGESIGDVGLPGESL